MAKSPSSPKKIAVKRAPPSARSRTAPIKGSIERIKGFNTLTIYRMAASPYWYARYFEAEKIYRRSTKTADKKKAKAFAKNWFGELKASSINRPPYSRNSGFEICAWGLMEENKVRLARGELAATKLDFDEARLIKDILPFFKNYKVADVDYKAISSYINSLSTPQRKLSINSLKIHLSHIKTILRYAQRESVITALPAFPTLKTIDKPRGWFNSFEYNKLHNTAYANIGKVFKQVSSKGEQLRNIELTAELYDLILFMTNTFIRPTDIKVLKHKHVTIVRRSHQYLRLNHPPTKNHTSPVVSMPAAIKVYERLLKRQKAEGYGAAEDYVFQPNYSENRTYAMRVLHRQFDQLLRMTSLKHDALGESRSLYSLRHSAIMFRLIRSDGLDLLTLARSARTSVEILDRFYAKHLTAEMNVQILQSQRKKRKPEAFEDDGGAGH